MNFISFIALLNCYLRNLFSNWDSNPQNMLGISTFYDNIFYVEELQPESNVEDCQLLEAGKK